MEKLDKGTEILQTVNVADYNRLGIHGCGYEIEKKEILLNLMLHWFALLSL